MASRFTRAGIHSVPDVVFCSQQLALETDFKIFQDRNNSHHFHILCYIKNIQHNQQRDMWCTQSRKYNLTKANWKKFNLLITESLRNNPPSTYEEFMDIVSLTMAESAPIHKDATKYGLPWWDNDCTDAIKRKRQDFRMYKEDPSDENFVEVLRIRAQVRRLLKEKKKAGFLIFCENLRPSTSWLFGRICGVLLKELTTIFLFIFSSRKICSSRWCGQPSRWTIFRGRIFP
mgnify:CR=1 FL=1